jgi:adenylate cyclase
MQQQQRHLAAILFTDIVGYTGMMQKDEALAVAVIRRYNAVLEKLVAEHHGEVVNNYGDGSLCTFSSTTDAVKCAVLIQEQLLKSDPPVPLRIGLHVGELVFEDGKAFGDGVNIASRIQSLGQANTILFSKEVFDKIRNQPGFKSLSLGSFEFKNVNDPIEVFALANEGLSIPKRENMEGKLKSGLPKSNKGLQRKTVIAASVVLLLIAGFFIYSMLHKKTGFTGKEKSIAVLPFINMSDEKGNEYFSDGMTEEITTQLSKIADLKVIARTSSMQYKGSKKSIKEIAEELGVASILEGSVQKIGNDIRITAQLIDANSQQHIWAEKYDRSLKDIFAIQSEVAGQIALQLKANMTKDEKNKIEKVPTDNPQAYEFYLQGNQLHEKFRQTLKQEYFDNSRLMFEKAIALDPNYAHAHAGLAQLYNTYTDLVKKDSVMIAIQLKEINKAYSLAPETDYVNSAKGEIFRTALDSLEESYKSFRKAFEINPNNTATLYGFAMLLDQLGLTDERIILLKKAVKLDPLNASYFGFLGGAEVHLNRLDEGIKDLQTANRLAPDMFYVIDRIAYAYALQNNLKETDNWLKIFLKQIPTYRENTFYPVYGYYSAYCNVKLGNKKRALELTKNWRVYLALGMKKEALQLIYQEANNSKYNDYLKFKTHLPHEDFDIIRNDPRFLQLMEKKRMQYEENKKKFSIVGLIN